MDRWLAAKSATFNDIDYIKLADWTGRITRDAKRGAIAETTPLILHRLISEVLYRPRSLFNLNTIFAVTALRASFLLPAALLASRPVAIFHEALSLTHLQWYRSYEKQIHWGQINFSFGKSNYVYCVAKLTRCCHRV